MNKEPLRGTEWLWAGTHEAPRVPPKPPSASPLRHGAATTTAVSAATDQIYVVAQTERTLR